MTTSPKRRARRLAIGVTAGVVLVLGGGFAWAGSQGVESGSSPRQTETTSRSSTDAPVLGTSRPTSEPSSSRAPAIEAAPLPSASVEPVFGEIVLSTVPIDAMADLGGLVTARITDITPDTVVGSGVGEVSGPSVRIEVELVNGTAQPLALAEVTVNAYFGPDVVPASPILANKNAEEFSGTLAAGASARAHYSFSVPTDEQGALTVTVSKAAGSPIVVFG